MSSKEYDRRYRLTDDGLCSAKLASRRHQKKVTAEIAKLKTGPCTDCGMCFDPVCMDFDHRPGEIKLGGVGQLKNHSRAKVLAEIAKCDLVCSNCHRIRTFRKRDHGATRRGQNVAVAPDAQLSLIEASIVRRDEAPAPHCWFINIDAAAAYGHLKRCRQKAKDGFAGMCLAHKRLLERPPSKIEIEGLRRVGLTRDTITEQLWVKS